MLPILLSLGGLNALAPVIIIIILIAAAAGLTRGADIFAMLGIGSLLGIASGFGGGGVGRGLANRRARFANKGAVNAAKNIGKANRARINAKPGMARAKTLSILKAQQMGRAKPPQAGLVKFATRFGFTPRPGTKPITAAQMRDLKTKRAQINREFRAETVKEVRKNMESMGKMSSKTMLGAAFGGLSRYMTKSRESRQIKLLTKRANETSKVWLNLVKPGAERDKALGKLNSKGELEPAGMYKRYKDARDGVYDPKTGKQVRPGLFDYQEKKELAMVKIDEGRVDLKKAQRQLSNANNEVKNLTASIASAKASGASAAAVSALQSRLNDASTRANTLQNDVNNRQAELTKLSHEYKQASDMERRMQGIMDRASVAMEEFVAKNHATPHGTMATLGNVYNIKSWVSLAKINAINGQLSDPVLSNPKSDAMTKHEYAMNQLFQKVYKEHGYEAAAEAVGSQWLNQQIKSMSEVGIDKPRGQARMQDAIRLKYVNAYYEDMQKGSKPGMHSDLASFMSEISRKQLERREEELLAAHRERGILEQRSHVYVPDLVQQHIDMKKKFEDYARRMQSPH